MVLTVPERCKIDVLQEALFDSIRSSIAWKNESGPLTDTVRIFLPADPSQNKGFMMVPVRLEKAWLMLKELGILSNYVS